MSEKIGGALFALVFADLDHVALGVESDAIRLFDIDFDAGRRFPLLEQLGYRRKVLGRIQVQRRAQDFFGVRQEQPKARNEGQRQRDGVQRQPTIALRRQRQLLLLELSG